MSSFPHVFRMKSPDSLWWTIEASFEYSRKDSLQLEAWCWRMCLTFRELKTKEGFSTWFCMVLLNIHGPYTSLKTTTLFLISFVAIAHVQESSLNKTKTPGTTFPLPRKPTFPPKDWWLEGWKMVGRLPFRNGPLSGLHIHLPCAEVDTLDPFNEGIHFSVRPPKKSNLAERRVEDGWGCLGWGKVNGGRPGS